MDKNSSIHSEEIKRAYGIMGVTAQTFAFELEFFLSSILAKVTIGPIVYAFYFYDKVVPFLTFGTFIGRKPTGHA